MGSTTIGYLIRKYAAVVIFPTIVFSSIYADLRRTQKWKARLAEQNKEQ
ncbi:hypothetical protein TSAR_010844 [Trichomalopsis sarcophagae]|uniref:Uncharacterized protein n=1 Tax=Trichomalopsis sarcophagae TaxID=543379 RepID=A0A232F872_9HYME|nr:hypothetical protein TSAR_010844 [Trichomalopsis sarcophagae]